MKTIIKIMPVLMFFLFLSNLGFSETKKPLVYMYVPPWKDNGENLREIVEKDNHWISTREKIDAIGYWPLLLQLHFTADQRTAFFTKMKEWNKLFVMEIPVVKGNDWCGPMTALDAKSAIELYLAQEELFKKEGMPEIFMFSFDEPIYAARHVIPTQISNKTLEIDDYTYSDDPKERMNYGIKETAKFIRDIRKHCPNAKIANIEPYPVMPLDELKYAFDGIQEECKKLGVKGLDSFRVDVDWANMYSGFYKGNWTEMKELCDYVKSKNTDFGMIYWASDMPYLDMKNIKYNTSWYVGIMHQGNILKQIGLEPDEYIIESWIHMDNNMTPESDITSFSRSILDFCNAFVK